MPAHYGNKTLYFKVEDLPVFLEAKRLADYNNIPLGELVTKLLVEWMETLPHCKSCLSSLRSCDNWCPKCGKKKS